MSKFFLIAGTSSTAVELGIVLPITASFEIGGTSSTAFSLSVDLSGESADFDIGGTSSTAFELGVALGEGAGGTPVTCPPNVLRLLVGDSGDIGFPTNNLFLRVSPAAFTPPPNVLRLNVFDPAILEFSAQQWKAKVTFDGDDISDTIIGDVCVEAEEGLARIARFNQRVTGTINVPGLVGKPVTIDYILQDLNTGDPAMTVRLFTGTVDVPQFDPSSLLVSFLCNDGLNSILAKSTRAGLDQLYTGSHWSQWVFNPTANSLEYAQSLALTVPGSVDCDAYGVPRLTDWASKDDPDFTVDASRALDATLSFEFTNRTSVKNMVQIEFQYRYPRLHYRTTAVSWDMGKTLGELFLSNFTIPTRAMIEQAANSLNGWDVTGISFEPPPPSQIIDLGGGDIGIWVCTPGVQAQLAWKAGYGLAKRWVQTITEEYVMIVKNEASIDALGPLVETDQASIEVTPSYFDSTGWEAQKGTGAYFEGAAARGVIKPVPSFVAPYNGGTVSGGGFNGGEWIYDVTVQTGTARADADNAIVTLQAKAKARILSTHRLNRARLRAPLNPFMDLTHTIECSTDHMTTKGKASQIVWTMEANGKATMEVQIAISGVGAVGDQVEIPLGPPPLPILPGPLTQPTISLPTLFGGNTTSIFPQPSIAGVALQFALGYHGNQQSGTGYDPTKPYQEGFRVTAPPILAEDMDPLTVGQFQAHLGFLTGDVTVTPLQTTITVNSAPLSPVFPFVIQVASAAHTVVLPDGTFVARSGDELMQVTNITGTSWSVVRGYASTTPLDHFTGDEVTLVAEPIDIAVPQDLLTLIGAP